MVADAAEDLEELRWHIEHVQARLGALRPLPDGPAASVRAELERQVAALGRALDADRAPGPGAPETPPLVRHQGGLRQLYQALALLETAPDWHSSPGSLEPPIRDLTPLSHVPGFNDYQRGFLPWLGAHEQHFLRTSQPALAGRALLCSSGMGAIQTVLQLVLARARRLLLGRRTYYETQTLLALGGTRARLRPLDEAEPRLEALVDRIREVDAIFADTITLDREALPLDVPRLYRAIEAALAASGRAEIELVLDNTVPGPERPIPPPPPGVRLYVVESLLKSYQAGLDLAAAGMLIVVASADAARDASLVHDLEVLRSTNGTNLAPYNARLLPLLPRDRILARLARQSRNAALLADGLRDRCEVTRVPHAGLVFCPHPRAAQLLSVIELLALARRVRIVRGTSFGFNDTRVALVPGLEDQVRFACGMEHAAAAGALVRLVRQAVEAVEDPAVRAACVHLS
ncbi:MAG TPA: PLP-dependent transferase, partial [Kofleriaceae bacterium]|nr:PLP-dependent transferase [Kofleriaceae bacterium]